jgi:hypothetical protein
LFGLLNLVEKILWMGLLFLFVEEEGAEEPEKKLLVFEIV